MGNICKRNENDKNNIGDIHTYNDADNEDNKYEKIPSIENDCSYEHKYFWKRKDDNVEI